MTFLDDERTLADAEIRALKELDLNHVNPAGHSRIGTADGHALAEAWRALNTPSR